MTASINIPNGIKTLTGVPEISKYFNNDGSPYISTTEANTQLPVGVRHIGLTINIGGYEYWWKDNVNTLILKTATGLSTGTVNVIPKYTSTGLIDSIISDNGSTVSISGIFKATSVGVIGGLSTQFLKADGSLDSTNYATDSNVSNVWSSPISLAPFLAAGVTSSDASYRRKGNVIQLTLSVSGVTPSNTFITLPPELRHAGNFIYLTAQVDAKPRLLVFSSDGTIKTLDGSNIAWGEISLMAQYSV